MQLGVRSGMVRSTEDCRSGVDAIKDRFKKLSQANRPEAILKEWYTIMFQTQEYYNNIAVNESELWKKKKTKTPLESVQEALIAGRCMEYRL